MDKAKMKKKIENKFRLKPKGRLVYNFKSGSKIGIEYMYGGKYCVKRKEKGKKAVIIEMIATSDKVVDLLIKEKTKQLFKIKL